MRTWMWNLTRMLRKSVGCGPGGLLSALECWRKGCEVEIIDRSHAPLNTGTYPSPMVLKPPSKLAADPIDPGDVFCLQPSCMSVFQHWPRLQKEIEEEQYDAGVSYWHNSGHKIYGAPAAPEIWHFLCECERKADLAPLFQVRAHQSSTTTRRAARAHMSVSCRDASSFSTCCFARPQDAASP